MAQDAKARISIYADNQVSKGLESAKKEVTGFSRSIQEMGSKLSKAFAFTAIVAGVVKLTKASFDSMKAFEEANRKYKQLAITLGDTKAYENSVKLINNLSKQTLEGKDSIESMVSELAALGKSESEIEKISSAAVYLSNVTGKDLNSSMTTLMNTYNGTTTALNKLGIDTSNLTKEQLANGEAVDVVIGKFKDLSEAMSSNDVSQSLKNIKDNLGDIKQSFGQIVSTAFSPMIKDFEDTTEKIKTKFQGFVDNFVIILQNFSTVWNKVLETAQSMFKKLFQWENIKALFNAFINSIKIAWNTLSNAIVNDTETVASIIKQLASGIGNYVLGIISGLCRDAGIDVNGILTDVVDWLKSTGTIFDEFISGIINAFLEAKTVILGSFRMIGVLPSVLVNTFREMREDFYQFLSWCWEVIYELARKLNVRQWIENLRVGFKNLFGFIGEGLVAFTYTFEDSFRYVGDVVKAVWDYIKGRIANAFGYIGGEIGAFADTVRDTFRYIADIMKATFSWDTIKNSALSMIENFCNFFIDAINGLIPDWFSKIPGLKEVKGLSRVSLTDGNVTNPYANIQGITKGVNQFEGTVTEKLSDVIAGIDEITVYTNNHKDETPEEIISPLMQFAEEQMEYWENMFWEAPAANWNEVAEAWKIALGEGEEYTRKTAVQFSDILLQLAETSTEDFFGKSADAFSDVSDLIKKLGKNMKLELTDGWSQLSELWTTVGTNIFGDDIEGFKTWLKEFIDQWKAAMEDMSAATGSGSGSGSENSTVEVSGSNVPGIDIDSFGPKAIMSSLSDSIIGGLGDFFGGMGMAEWFAGGILTEVQKWFSIITPLFDALNSGINPLQWIAHILEGFVTIMEPALDAVFAPLVDIFKLIGESLGTLLLPLMDSLGDIIGNVARILGAVLMPILQMLAPIFEIIGMVGDALSGVFALLTKAVIVLMSPVQWLGDAFKWVAEWIKYFGKCIRETISHLFDLRNADYSGKPGSFESDAFSGLGERLEMADNYTNAASMSANSSLSGTVQNASYTGAGSITLNVYVEGNIVGEGGMTELAKRMRTEFEALNYYGI